MRARGGAAKGSDRSLLRQVGQYEEACLARARDYHDQVCMHAPRVVQPLRPTKCAGVRESAREKEGESESDRDRERESGRGREGERESESARERASEREKDNGGASPARVRTP